MEFYVLTYMCCCNLSFGVALNETQAVLGRVIPGGVGAGVGDENAESWGVVQPLRIPFVIRPLRSTYVAVVR